MAVVRKNLVLMFGAADDSKLEITVLKPMESLQGSEIRAAMETIITTGALGVTSQATKIIGAEYDIREIEPVVLGQERSKRQWIQRETTKGKNLVVSIKKQGRGVQVEDILQQISNLGFPIILSMYLLMRIEGKMEELTKSIQRLSIVLDKDEKTQCETRV